MSLLINLTPAEEARLSAAARRRGVAPAQFAETLLRENLPEEVDADVNDVLAKLHQWQAETGTKTSAHKSASVLFAEWAEEDANMTVAEREAENQLWSDIERGINETRAELGMRFL
ncbi:MAG: hypothetical protein ABIY70_01530 [Capsulimonas sp.]|uniref:hypothetical protein n=1 Tax=Capsulimonas sp. TaxID=2494211 RepID=UPI0032665A83